MKTVGLCLVVFVVTFSWLQVAESRHIHRSHHHNRHFASDDTPTYNNKLKRVAAELKEYLVQKDPYFGGEEESDGQPEINENDVPKEGELFEDDIIMDKELRRAVLGLNKKRSAIELAKEGRRRHWPGGIVPYVIDDSLSKHLVDRVHEAIRNFNHYTCVKFVPKTERDKDYVVFKTGEGCSSSVGRQGGEQSIHLAKGCERIGTVMHEMMHAIGIIHEQSRPDRDEHVEVMFDHIKPKLFTNFRKYTFGETDSMDIPYNYYSVMHYSNYAFSSDEHITIRSRADHKLRFGQRLKWTPLDVEKINKLYPCDKRVDMSHLLPDMTERDVEEKKRDEMRDLYLDLF